MTYACPAWEFAADTHLLKLQRLQNKVLRTIDNFPRHMPVYELHKAFITAVLHTLGPPLWSSGQSSWLQIQRPGFDSWAL
jgi:hypothetical protein